MKNTSYVYPCGPTIDEVLCIADVGANPNSATGVTNPIYRGSGDWNGGTNVDPAFRHPGDTKSVLFLDLHGDAVSNKQNMTAELYLDE